MKNEGKVFKEKNQDIVKHRYMVTDFFKEKMHLLSSILQKLVMKCTTELS